MVLPNEQLKALVLEQGIIDEASLKDVLLTAPSANTSLGAALVEKNIITDQKLGEIVSQYLGVPFVVLAQITIPEEVFRIIPERIIRKHKVMAFNRDESGIKIALSDPTNQLLLGNIAKKVGAPVFPHYATERDIEATMQIYKQVLQKTIDVLLKEDIQKATKQVLDEAPVIKIVDTLLEFAYQDKASDVHIEPEEQNSLIRFRIDGILHDVLRVPRTLHERITTRIKVLSSLRTDEHLSAQDGKMRLKLEEELLDIRVSIIPIVGGEKVVLRLLATNTRMYTLADLGMSEVDLKKVSSAMNKSYGMLLSTGPTGSGKSTSIYSILKILNTREKNITTVEDPVEYWIRGANQVQVNAKTNLTFANGLRSILRQDPNIIFVGEIRDNETAGIAVNAALTGHLVLSTLHTNDAATAIPRFIDMKVEPFLVASTVNVIIAQRLVRKICEACKSEVAMSRVDLEKHFRPEILEKYFGNEAEVKIHKGRGCKICHYTGYSGRLGVFEVLEVTKGIRQLITERTDADEISKAACAEGMTLMVEDGLKKVSRGLTTIEEVIRVTKVESL